MKEYPYKHKVVKNAMMVFDEKKLEPTYVLKIGYPGRSYGLEMARRYHLDNKIIEDAVWTRRLKRRNLLLWPGEVIGYNRIGKEGYLAITGHTPVTDEKGFVYYEDEHCLNIDGGCALYAMGCIEFDHVPLVEVKKDYLKILIFNHNNEIINGFYFEKTPLQMSDEDLNKERLFINHELNNNGQKNKELILEILEDTK